MAQDSSEMDVGQANQNKRKAKQQLKDLTRNQRLLDSVEPLNEDNEPHRFNSILTQQFGILRANSGSHSLTKAWSHQKEGP